MLNVKIETRYLNAKSLSNTQRYTEKNRTEFKKYVMNSVGNYKIKYVMNRV